MGVSKDESDIRDPCQLGKLIGDAMLSYKYATVNDSTPCMCLMDGGTIGNSFVIGAVTLHNLVIICLLGITIVSTAMTYWEVMDVLSDTLSNTAPKDPVAIPEGLAHIKITKHMDGS